MIYRLETIDGHGPFYGEQECCMWLKQHHDPDSPGMLESIGHTPKQFKQLSEYVYGWRNLKLMRQFVPKRRREKFHAHGFAVGVYEVTRSSALCFFDGQVAFKKTRAHLIERRPLTEL